MQGLKARIVKWNRDRGLLEPGFDPALEVKMLSEEAREFFLAETFEHQLAEYSDFLFVMTGTRAKFFSTIHESPTVMAYILPQWDSIDTWMEETKQEMYDVLVSVATVRCYTNLLGMITESLKIVTGCNEIKGTKKCNGKVVKNKIHVDPVDKIKEMIRGYQSN